jgi:hypothetical protein
VYELQILFNVLVNLLHKTIVGIPYQISGVKNNFIVIKLQIRRFYLPEDWLTVVVILSGGTMSMVLLVLVMIQNNVVFIKPQTYLLNVKDVLEHIFAKLTKPFLMLLK